MFEINVSMGITKAAVFPEPGDWISAIFDTDIQYQIAPVSAIPMISRFCNPMGMA
jgi:hypothetical protein